MVTPLRAPRLAMVCNSAQAGTLGRRNPKSRRNRKTSRERTTPGYKKKVSGSKDRRRPANPDRHPRSRAETRTKTGNNRADCNVSNSNNNVTLCLHEPAALVNSDSRVNRSHGVKNATAKALVRNANKRPSGRNVNKRPSARSVSKLLPNVPSVNKLPSAPSVNKRPSARRRRGKSRVRRVVEVSRTRPHPEIGSLPVLPRVVAIAAAAVAKLAAKAGAKVSPKASPMCADRVVENAGAEIARAHLITQSDRIKAHMGAIAGPTGLSPPCALEPDAGYRQQESVAGGLGSRPI